MFNNNNDQTPEGTKKRKSSSRLNREDIVTLALHIADTEGIDAVSFRRLAQELGVTPMAIYRHVHNKDDLLDAMTEHMLASFDISAVKETNWRDQVRGLLYALRQVLLIHPSGKTLLSRRSLPATNRLKIFELSLGILRSAGFESREAFYIFEHLLNQVVSLVAAGDGYVQGTEEERSLWGAQLLGFYGNLPQQEYPSLVEAAPNIAASVDKDRHFKFGTDLLVAGVEAMAASVRLNNP
ncbi:TetR/AcrR family transcriptional regulator C-terminal domain-containing protein [Paenibacillus hexagrammi]|uniref:TetR/AcrR family transcriptional regulator C-terminal domain-containing protein n=1 Tax=Paenibacillus hexagrammi TaxID=2908839 RepID=A0ABY3SLJ4_9BACL|nr:TetR/AcrR family transcriptional regulator C-terminal domain-containing protein [Paenibacillus sp. YPD9-1]UJF33985.1 TetR/AcrR family transcriptional regulator C-terminal domain-containing protein [Paenibacillus sp. YPD9-1]